MVISQHLLAPGHLAMSSIHGRRGALILFEGVDRCGKTTQARGLVTSLLAEAATSGAPAGAAPAALGMRFPDRETAVGSVLNAYLQSSAELDDCAVHLLFAANRWEARETLLRALRAGTDVVLDRYAFSGAAFTAAKPSLTARGLDLSWAQAPDTGLPAPDLVLFMDLAPAAAAARGGYGGERYEVPAFQAAVRSKFAELREQSRAVFPGVWHDVDADGDINAVAARIAPLVQAARARVRAGAPLRSLWDGRPFVDEAAAAATATGSAAVPQAPLV